MNAITSASTELNNLPVNGLRLSQPVEAINSFFDTYGCRLPHSMLKDLLKAAFSSEQAELWSSTQRANYMTFCERLTALMNACSSLTGLPAGESGGYCFNDKSSGV